VGVNVANSAMTEN